MRADFKFFLYKHHSHACDRLSRMFWDRVSMTMQRTGSDPWACVLLRLPRDRGKDRFFALQALHSHQASKEQLGGGGI